MPQYIPEIAQAYQNDPRTKLAQTMMQTGASTAPVAQGGWGWADGIARALSGVAGAYAAKRQEKKYDARQQDIVDEAHAAIAAALKGGAAAPGGTGGGLAVPPPQGVQQPGGGASAAQAQPLVPAPVPPPQNNSAPPPMAPPPAPPAPPVAAPSGPQGGPPPSIPAPGPQGFDALGRGAPAAPQPGRQYSVADAVAELGMTPEQAQQYVGTGKDPRQQIAAALAGGGAGNTAVPFTAPNGLALVNAMVPITALSESGGQDFSAGGKPVTSVKGAKYQMQVMPATARNPGFGIKPAANDSPDEYNRVGTELLGKLQAKYGDPAKAWAAYNGGTGRVDHAIAKHGDQWLSAMPKETQAYVAKNVAALGGDKTPSFIANAPQSLQPTGATPYDTPEPGVPDLPARPQDRPAAQSLRLSAGQKLLAMRDPALFERAMSMLDSGMGEQFASDRDALANANGMDKDVYDAASGDAYNARQQQRGAAYDQRAREYNENNAYSREVRGYVHDDNTLGQQETFTASESAKDRAATAANVQAQIEGKHQDAEEKKAARLQNFLNTPAGAKMYNDSTATINNNGNLASQVDQFMSINEENPNSTGGMMMNLPTNAGEWAARNMNNATQEMDSITHNLAPMIRQKGQGSMSDRDLEMFERAIPNVHNTITTNRARAAQFKAGVARMNDFEMHKLQAAADGSQVDFLKKWEAYRNSVPIDKGTSFDDWQAANTYDASGKRK